MKDDISNPRVIHAVPSGQQMSTELQGPGTISGLTKLANELGGYLCALNGKM